MDGPGLNEKEIYKAAQTVLIGNDEWGYQRVAAAATRKAVTWLQEKMAKQGTLESSTAPYWRHCAENVKFWLEMEGIAPWEATDDPAA